MSRMRILSEITCTSSVKNDFRFGCSLGGMSNVKSMIDFGLVSKGNGRSQAGGTRAETARAPALSSGVEMRAAEVVETVSLDFDVAVAASKAI